MRRRPDWAGKRTEFSGSVRAAVAARSGGVCENDGCGAVASEFDHITADGLGGQATADNCRHLCGACHDDKSKDDIRRMIRADKKGGRLGQYARRQRAKALGRPPSIPSKPFPGSKRSGWKKPVRGNGVKRGGQS